MISYTELRDLDGEVGDQYRELLELRFQIDDMPDSMAKVEAAEEVYRAVEELGVPHLMASLRLIQVDTLFGTDRPREALQFYLQLLQHISRYGSYIDPRNLARARKLAPAMIQDMMDLPDIGLDRVERVLMLLEKQIREHNGSLADLHLARATVAANRGDLAGTRAQLEQWEAAGDPGWAVTDDGVVQHEIAVLERVDTAGALQLLQRRIGRLELDEEDEVYWLVHRAALLAKVGDADESGRIMRTVLTRHPLELLLEIIQPDDLLSALRAFPEELQQAARHFRMLLDLRNAANLFALGGLAHDRLHRDPADPDGIAFAQLANAHADDLDRRNGTDGARRMLEHWWPGIGAYRAELDADQRLELLTEVLTRNLPGPVVGADQVPYSLRDRYAAMGDRVRDFFEAETIAEAEQLAEQQITEAERLKYPLGVIIGLLGLTVAQLSLSEAEHAPRTYAGLQRLLLREGGRIDAAVVHSLVPAIFLPNVQNQLLHPDQSLAEIEGTIDRQEQIHQLLELPHHPIPLARALLATEVGDERAVQQHWEEVYSDLRTESPEPGRIELELLRRATRFEPERALGLAERMSEQPDLPQDTVREVAVLLAYLQRTVAGDPAASRRARQILADTGDDLSEVSAVAELLVALEGVEDLDRIIDIADHQAREQWPGSLPEAAALAGLLRRNRPADPRAAEWTTRVTDELAARDRRNGNPSLSRYLTSRFLGAPEPAPGDLS